MSRLNKLIVKNINLFKEKEFNFSNPITILYADNDAKYLSCFNTFTLLLEGGRFFDLKTSGARENSEMVAYVDNGLHEGEITFCLGDSIKKGRFSRIFIAKGSDGNHLQNPFLQASLEEAESLMFVNQYDLVRYTFKYGHNFNEASMFYQKLQEYFRLASHDDVCDLQIREDCLAKHIFSKKYWGAVKEFLPIFKKSFGTRTLNESHHLYYTIDDNYVIKYNFIVNGAEQEDVGLSAQDRLIFDYLCFLEINRFWQELYAYMGLKCAMAPLFVTNLLEGLNKYAPIELLLKKASDMGRQVIVLTRNNKVDIPYTSI